MSINLCHCFCGFSNCLRCVRCQLLNFFLKFCQRTLLQFKLQLLNLLLHLRLLLGRVVVLLCFNFFLCLHDIG